MRDFEVTIRLRNNQLRRRRRDLGLSVRQMAEQIGVSYASYLELEALRASPLRKDGQWREVAVAIAAYHGVLFEELWPETILAVRVSEVTRELDGYSVAALAEAQIDPEQHLLLAESAGVAAQVLEQLSPLHRQVIELRAQGATLQEIGEVLGKSKERVRQIEMCVIDAARSVALRNPQIRDLVESQLGTTVSLPQKERIRRREMERRIGWEREREREHLRYVERIYGHPNKGSSS